MLAIDRLIAADAATKKRIVVIGCSMRDVHIHGDLLPSQDGVQKFVERRRLDTPGGAAGAARQLCRWNAQAVLLSAVLEGDGEPWGQVYTERSVVSRRMPEKHRFLDEQGRILWRHDVENGYGADANLMEKWRAATLHHLKCLDPDAVLISDYDKGFLTEQMIREVIGWCRQRGILVVADCKRPPAVYEGAVRKANRAYHEWHALPPMLTRFREGYVWTDGPHNPNVNDSIEVMLRPAVRCLNHVGAGDAFAAHLTLALAHGFNLDEAAFMAHSAGRVYVQHLHGRPAFPHEIRRDLDPVGGKVIATGTLSALRRSVPGRIVFTNGVFRLGPHAGHAWLAGWAKSQGDVLVVGLNDDASAGRIRSGKAVRPLAERAYALAALDAADWVVPFGDDDPCSVIAELKPDMLVKGHDYWGRLVPGHDLVPEVRFAPESPFPRHTSEIEAGIRLPASPVAAL